VNSFNYCALETYKIHNSLTVGKAGIGNSFDKKYRILLTVINIIENLVRIHLFVLLGHNMKDIYVGNT